MQYNTRVAEVQCELLIQNINSLLKLHHEMNKDTVIIFGGNPGTGKSTVMLFIWNLINEAENQFPTLKHDFIETYDDMLRHLKTHHMTRGKTMLIDEGSHFANARKSMYREQTELYELMDIIREAQQRMLISAPRIWKLDKSIRERSDVHIRTFYDIKTKQYRIAFYSGATVPDMLLSPKASAVFGDPVKFFKIFPPNFYGSIPDLEPGLKKEYLSYKQEFRTRLIDEKLEGKQNTELQFAKEEDTRYISDNHDPFDCDEIDLNLPKSYLTCHQPNSPLRNVKN